MPVYTEHSYHLPFSERATALLLEQARRNAPAWRELGCASLAGLKSHRPGTQLSNLPTDLLETLTSKLTSNDVSALQALLYGRLSPKGQSKLLASAARAAGFVRRPRGSWDAHLRALAKDARPGVFLGLLTHTDAILAGVLLGSLAPHVALTHYKPTRAIAVAVVARHGHLITLLPPSLQMDPAVLRSAFLEGGACFTELGARFASCREAVLWAVRGDARMLMHASPVFRGDREVMCAAVGQRGALLEHASDALRNDREVVLGAVRQDPQAFKFASLALRDDREIVQAAVSRQAWLVIYASERLKRDPALQHAYNF